MSRINFLLFFIIFLSAFFYGDESMKCNDPLYLSDVQIETYSVLALRGDPLKASYLNDFFALYEDKISEGEYWIMIGAENGDKTLEFNYACTLKDIYNDKQRALFYFKNAAEKGLESAKMLVKDKTEYSVPSENLLPLAVDKKNIKQFTNAAKLGSKKAAEKLIDYYRSQKIEMKKIDSVERMNKEDTFIYWLRIGAQNGSKECMKEYAELLRKSSDKYDNIRAEFWEKRSKT